MPQRINPYVGLRPFTAADAPVFFGRREHTAAVLERLRRSRFVPVVGTRTSGASSLVQAGVVPALRAGYAVAGRTNWTTVLCRPGTAPWLNLAQALLTIGDTPQLAQAATIAPSAASVRDFADRLRQEGVSAVRERLAVSEGAARGETNLLLVVDQFEEVFGQADAASYVSLLLELAQTPELPAFVLLALNADALGDCAQFAGLAELVNTQLYLLPTLTTAQIIEAIEQPVLRAGARVAPALVERLVTSAEWKEAAAGHDLLPLLQHTMHRVWEQWAKTLPAADAALDRAPLDLSHLDAVGGLANALTAETERVVSRHDRELVARVFKRLTQIDGRGHRTRRPARLSELRAVTASKGADAKARLDLLLNDLTAADVHLLTRYDDGAPDDPRYLLTNECLLRQWLVLRTWMDEEQALGAWYYALADRASRHARGADVELLTRPAWQLANQRLNGPVTDAWVAGRYDDTAAPLRLVRSFVDDSRASRMRRNMTRAGVVALLVATFVFLQVRESATDRAARKQQLEAVLSASLQRFAASDPTYGQLLAGFLGVELSEDSLRASVHRLEERPAALLEIPQVAASAILDSTQVVVAFLSGNVTVASASVPQRIVGVVPRADGSAPVDAMQLLRKRTLLLVDSAGMLESYRLDQPSRPQQLTARLPLRSRVVRMARSADSLSVALQMADGRLLHWHVDAPERVADLGTTLFVTAFAFSPVDGERLVLAAGRDTNLTASSDTSGSNITIVSAIRGVVQRTAVAQTRAPVQQLALATDGRVVAIMGSTLLEWSRTGTARVTPDAHATVLAALPDSTATVAAGTLDGQVLLLRPGQSASPVRLAEHGDFVSALAVADANYLLSASADHGVRYTALGDGTDHYTLDGHRAVVREGHADAGHGLLTTLDDDERLRVWSAASWGSRYLWHGERVTAPTMMVSRFGDRAVTTLDDSLVVEESGAVRRVAPLPTVSTRLLALSPAGTAAILGDESGTRWWWRDAAATAATAASATPRDSLAMMRNGFGARGVRFNHDGTIVVGAHADSTISVLNGVTFSEQTASAWAGVRVPTAPSLDSAGTQMAYFDAAGVHVRTVATAKLVRTFPRRVNSPTVYQTLFPSGKRVLWLDDDGRVFLRDVARAADSTVVRAAFTGAPRTSIVAFATRRDEYVFAYVTDRGGLFLLEALPTSLRQVALPMQLESKDAVRHVAFDSSGLRIVATTAFGSVHVWELWWDASTEMMRARTLMKREHSPHVRRSSVVQLATSAFSEDGMLLHSFLSLPGERSRRRSWELDADLVRTHADQWKTRCVDFRALFREAGREFERDNNSCVFNPGTARRTPPPAVKR